MSRQMFLFTIYGLMLVAQPAAPVVSKVPEVAEIDIKDQFRCQLDFNSNPDSLIFGQVINRAQRQILAINSRLDSSDSYMANCEVEEDTVYKCKWDLGSYVELPLNNAEWVYVNYKKFNYVLRGKFRLGLLGEEKDVRCSFVVEI